MAVVAFCSRDSAWPRSGCFFCLTACSKTKSKSCSRPNTASTKPWAWSCDSSSVAAYWPMALHRQDQRCNLHFRQRSGAGDSLDALPHLVERAVAQQVARLAGVHHCARALAAASMTRRPRSTEQGWAHPSGLRPSAESGLWHVSRCLCACQSTCVNTHLQLVLCRQHGGHVRLQGVQLLLPYIPLQALQHRAAEHS